MDSAAGEVGEKTRAVARQNGQTLSNSPEAGRLEAEITTVFLN